MYMYSGYKWRHIRALFIKFSFICFPWKRRKLEWLTLQRSTLLLLSNVSIKTIDTVGLCLWQRSALSEFFGRNPLQLESMYQYMFYWIARWCPVQVMREFLSVGCAGDHLLFCYRSRRLFLKKITSYCKWDFFWRYD